MVITVGASYTYTPFPGDQLDPLTLFPWKGKYVTVATQSNSLSPDIMTRMVDGLDAAYGVYAQITGRSPIPYVQYQGTLSIAQLPDNPSYTFAAHGYLGYSGIEIQNTYFQSLYKGLSTNTYDQALFYELGRNFWFYQSQLGAVDPFVTGFAIANRFVSMEVAGLAGAPFGSIPFATFKTQVVDGLSASFLGNGSYTLANTLQSGTAIAGSNWSVADLAGSLLYQVYENSGFFEYARFYQILSSQPATSTAPGAFANFISAATQATGIDFSFYNKAAGVAYQVGTAGDDSLAAGDVGTFIFGFGGNDTLTASPGGSSLLGGSGNDVLVGSSGNDLLAGGIGNDSIRGGAGADVLLGGDGADTLIGAIGNDSINGGAGIDVALFSSLFNQNAVSGSFAAGFAVIGGDGNDTVIGVEKLQFNDGTFIFDVNATGSQVARLYDTVLQRQPDTIGLDYYVDRIEDRGASIVTIAAEFLNSAEFQAATGALSNSAFVDYIYQHALGRAADAGGKSYYTGMLDNGGSRVDLLLSFSESTEHRSLTADTVARGYFDTDDSYQAVALLFDSFAGRKPDAGGLIYYAERLKAGSLTLAQASNDFAGSTEFQQATNGLSNGELVDYMYRNTLDREADAGGRAYYTNALDQGLSKGSLLLEFSQSQEHYNYLAGSIIGGIDVL